MSGPRSQRGWKRAIVPVPRPAQSSVRKSARVFAQRATHKLLTGTLTLTPNHALKQAIEEHQKQCVRMQQLTQQNRQLESAMKSPQDQRALRFYGADLLKPAPEEVKAWLKQLGLDHYAESLLASG